MSEKNADGTPKTGTDVLYGGNRIAEFLTEFLGVPVTRKRAYEMAASKVFPSTKVGAIVTSSRSAIRRSIRKPLGDE